MTDLIVDSQVYPLDAPDDQADLARRHRESLFPSVGLYYSEPIEVRFGESQFVYAGAGRLYLDFFGGIVTIKSWYWRPAPS
jgi:4-aminobutyrate aminotransferase-like enzyme